MSQTDATLTTPPTPPTPPTPEGSGSTDAERDRYGRIAPWRGMGRLLWSELKLIGGRRRNQVGLLVLAAVPILIAVTAKMSDPGPGGGPPLFNEILSNGLFVAVQALSMEVGMFLPLAIALLCGDAIAGEANQGTLRYLLTVPVGRTRLVLVKYLSLCVGALWGVAVVVLTGLAAGVALFGVGPVMTFSGSQIGFGDALIRLLLASLYVTVLLAALASVGLVVSTLTEQPLAATISVMIFTIAAFILHEIPQVDWIHPYLLVTEFSSFMDVFRDPPFSDAIRHGLLVAGGYVVICLGLAWARLTTKDVTS